MFKKFDLSPKNLLCPILFVTTLPLCAQTVPSTPTTPTTPISEQSKSPSGTTTENKSQIEQSENEQDTITVVATGNQRDSFVAPMMVTVLDNNTAESLTSTSAADLLRYIPGLTVMGSGRSNGQDIQLRGYGSKGVLTLIDGVRQGTDTGHLNGTFLDPALVKRVEVVRGPGALLYGNSALGGVIAYQTVDAVDLLMPGKSTGYRIFGQASTMDRGLGSGAAVYGKTDNLDGVFAYSYRNRGDLRQSNGVDSPNDESINSLFAKGTWKIDANQSLSGNLRYYNNQAEEPANPQKSQPATDNVMTDRSTITQDAQLDYHLKPIGQDWLDLSAIAYYSQVDIRDEPLQLPREKRKQITEGVKVENRSRLFISSPASHLLSYGTEVYQQSQRPGQGTPSFPKASIDFASGWLQDEITLRDLPIEFIFGTRYDNYQNSSTGYSDNKADQWSSRAAVSVTPTDWLMLFASYAQAFRAPTISEMYNNSKHFSAGPIVNRWKPNPNLKPESNETQEYGFGLRFDDLLLDNDTFKFKSSYFTTRAKDYITPEVTRTDSTFVNLARADIWGWDAGIEYTTDYFSWDLAYNHTQGKDTRTGDWINSINPDTLSSKLDVPITTTNFSVGWIGTFAAAHTKVTARSPREPNPRQKGYGVNDIYISYKGQGDWQGFTSAIVLDNVFDKEYYSPIGAIQNGRNLKLLISYQW